MLPRRLMRAEIIGLTTLLGLMVVFGFCPSLHAANFVTTIDAGGGRSVSASYTVDASVGSIGGISATAVDADKNGYIGQLYEVTNVLVTASPISVNEYSNALLTATATLDDATMLALAGVDVQWGISMFPIVSISVDGVATTTNVYQNTSATVNGSYLGVPGSGSLLVLDTNPDDYGTYAGDGIPDSWQAQFFGLDNPNAAPAEDADGTGQNNLFKYVAGLDPTDSASVFVLHIVDVTGQPDQKNLIFDPVVGGRTYTPVFRTNVVTGAYSALTGSGGPQTNGNQVTVTDLNATGPEKFYRIHISMP